MRDWTYRRCIPIARVGFSLVGAILIAVAGARLVFHISLWFRTNSTGMPFDPEASFDLMFLSLLVAGAMLILVVLGAVPGIKALGFELQLGDIFAWKSNDHTADIKALAAKIARLERHFPEGESTAGRAQGESTAPGSLRPLIHPNDCWRGRFKGMSHNDGFELSATFPRRASAEIEEVLLVVRTRKPGMDGQLAEFFVDQHLLDHAIEVPFEQGAAKLKLLIVRGFTVGAWIPKARIELELDLSTLPDAPAAIRLH